MTWDQAALSGPYFAQLSAVTVGPDDQGDSDPRVQMPACPGLLSACEEMPSRDHRPALHCPFPAPRPYVALVFLFA